MRTIAATELASSIDGLDIHLHEVPSGALAEGQYTEKFVQIFESDGRVRLASASLRDQPALVPIDVVRAAFRGQAPLASIVVGRRHGRVTVLAAPVGKQSYAILVGLYRDEVDATSRAPGLAARDGLGGRASWQPLRSVTGWRPGHSVPWSGLPAAPSALPRETSPRDSIPRPVRTKLAR